MDKALYFEIPDYPAEYSAGTILCRIIDGIGFRYHWATKDLTETELNFKLVESNRSILETMKHIDFLLTLINNSFQDQTYILPEKDSQLPYLELRLKSLQKIDHISRHLSSMTDQEFASLSSKYKLMDNDLIFPFWNLINGPFSDALYHVGQIVHIRRAAGNPINQEIHVFFGKKIPSDLADALRK